MIVFKELREIEKKLLIIILVRKKVITIVIINRKIIIIIIVKRIPISKK